MSETKIMRQVMVLAARIGIHLFRNNCGQYKTDTGQWVRFGVASPGGSDLIGWRALVVTQDMVGKTIAQFSAVEVKTKEGRLSKEQSAFIEIVNQCGGFACVARSAEEALIKLV